MRRLTDDEMGTRMARQGRRGPGWAIDALWELILQDAHGMSIAEAAGRPGSFRVQDYAITADQGGTLLAAMTKGRRLQQRVVASFHLEWATWSPADYYDWPAPSLSLRRALLVPSTQALSSRRRRYASSRAHRVNISAKAASSRNRLRIAVLAS